MQWIKLESRLRLRRKPTFTRTVQSCIVMDNYKRTKLFRSEYRWCPRNCVYNDPPVQQHSSTKNFRDPHVTARTPTRSARRGGVRNKKRANAVVHSLLGVTAASCAVPWIQAAPWRGMPLASDNRHSTLPSRRFWTSIRTAKYSRFARETSIGRLYRNDKNTRRFTTSSKTKKNLSVHAGAQRLRESNRYCRWGILMHARTRGPSPQQPTYPLIPPFPLITLYRRLFKMLTMLEQALCTSTWTAVSMDHSHWSTPV